MLAGSVPSHLPTSLQLLTRLQTLPQAPLPFRHGSTRINNLQLTLVYYNTNLVRFSPKLVLKRTKLISMLSTTVVVLLYTTFRQCYTAGALGANVRIAPATLTSIIATLLVVKTASQMRAVLAMHAPYAPTCLLETHTKTSLWGIAVASAAQVRHVSILLHLCLIPCSRA